MDARAAADAVKSRRVKSDKADAYALAEMLRTGWYRAVYVKSQGSHRLKAMRDTAAVDVLAEYEARIAALERLVGKLALENEFLKGVSRHVRQPKSASTSIVAGPLVSQSQKDAD